MGLRVELNQASSDYSIVILTLDVILLWLGFALPGNSWEQVSSSKREDRGVQEECLVSLGEWQDGGGDGVGSLVPEQVHTRET